MPPAVTIIVPTFNRLKYLRKTLASVLEQTFKDWELLIADDGSGADTRDWQRARSWPVPAGWIFDKLVRSETVMAVPSVVATRELLERVRGFDEGLVMCEDYDLWLKLASLSEIDAIDEPLTLVTRHAEHSGNEITSFEDCARVFEKVLSAPGTEHLHSIVREKLAEVAYGLARSQAACGNRASALRTLLSSARYCWRYRHWWLGALRAAAYACAPHAAVQAARKYRSVRRAHRGAQP